MAATNAEPQDVLNFWLKDVGPAGWYNSSDALDAEIRSRFEGLWSEADGSIPACGMAAAMTALAAAVTALIYRIGTSLMTRFSK